MSVVNNSRFSILLEEVLKLGKMNGIHSNEIARRCGIAPETLSRMKKRGNGDFAVLECMARLVGKRITLMTDDDTIEAIRRGEFF